MNLFRSEEHVERWLAGSEPGATIPVTTLAERPANLLFFARNLVRR